MLKQSWNEQGALFVIEDGTALGIAKARHYEAQWTGANLLTCDPYAEFTFPCALINLRRGKRPL